MATPPIYVQVSRRRQVFAFLMDCDDTVANVLQKIKAVEQQHEIPDASDDARLLLDANTAAEEDSTLASLLAAHSSTQQSSASSSSSSGNTNDTLSLHLVYALADGEYEPIEVEPTTTDS